MFHLFTCCIVCRERFDPTSDRNSFPICSLCQSSLLPCPALCPSCGSPVCPESPQKLCLRPWIRHDSIQSFSGLYLLLNSQFPVLKKWKTHRGSLFDRRVLIPNPKLRALLQDFQAQAITPIPQAFNRTWSMRGSPAEKIARWLSSITQIPVHPLLLSPTLRIGQQMKRQAELGILERLQSPLRFSLDPNYNLAPFQRIILVDDFLTSGRTVGQAAKTMKMAGINQIHSFCLGVRAPKEVPSV